MHHSPRSNHVRRAIALLLPALLAVVAGVCALGAPSARAAAPGAPVAPIEQGAAQGITVTMTVGTVSGQCPQTANHVTVKTGTPVYICYEVRNTLPLTGGSGVTFTNQVVYESDAETGANSRSADFAVPVPPQQSQFLPAMPPLTLPSSVVRSGVVAANNGNAAQVQASASVRITVTNPAITVKQTVSLSPAGCSSDVSLLAPVGANVYRCITLTNTGDTPLTSHELAISNSPGISATFPLTQTINQNDQVVLTSASPADLPQTAFVFAPAQTTTSTVGVKSLTAEGFSAAATSSATVNVGTAATTLGVSVNTVAACAPASVVNLNVVINTNVYYCLRLGNSGNTTLTQHVIGMTGQTPVTYSAALEPQATLVITTGTLTALGLSPILGPVTASANLNMTFVVTSTASGGFHFVQSVSNSVLASTPTRTPTTTPTLWPTSTLWPTWTPYPVAPTWTPWPTWTPTDTLEPPSPTWTRSFELSYLQTPTPGGFVDAQATAFAMGDPNAYYTPDPFATPAFDSGLPTPFIDPNQPEQVGAGLLITDTNTPTPIPTDTPTFEPTRTPLPTQPPSPTVTPTATQRPIVYTQPAPPTSFGGLFGAVLDSTFAAAALLFVTTGAVVFFAVLGLVLGLGFLRAGRRRFDLEDVGGNDPNFVAAPPQAGARDASEDRWPTSLP